MESRVRVRIKTKRESKLPKIISAIFFVSGIFFLGWSYMGITFEMLDFPDSGEHSMFFTENHFIWAAVGLALILSGFLIKYRKILLSKEKHKR